MREPETELAHYYGHRNNNHRHPDHARSPGDGARNRIRSLRAALEVVVAARGNRIQGRGPRPRPALHRRRRHRHEEADLRDEENQERSEAVVRHGCPRSIGLQSPGNAADVPPPIVKLGLL